ncbi:MAG: hypothetical protein V3R98_13000 [Alphaproteobacteria bacterium]
MQVSPSSALFQALSSLTQPQAAQAHGASAAPLTAAAAKTNTTIQTPQAVPAAQDAGALGGDQSESHDDAAPSRGQLLDISA